MEFTEQCAVIREHVGQSPLPCSPLAIVELADRIRAIVWQMRMKLGPPTERVSLKAAAIAVFNEYPLPVPDPVTEAALKDLLRPMFRDLIRGNLALRYRGTRPTKEDSEANRATYS